MVVEAQGGSPAFVALTDPEALAAWAQERDFAAQEQYDSGGFGNRMVVLRNQSLEFRLVRDLGQSFIEPGGVTWGDWFDPDVWRGCLEGEPCPTSRDRSSARRSG